MSARQRPDHATTDDAAAATAVYKAAAQGATSEDGETTRPRGRAVVRRSGGAALAQCLATCAGTVNHGKAASCNQQLPCDKACRMRFEQGLSIE